MKRRDFVLANIIGLGTSPFVGNIVEASPQQIDQFGTPDITLEKKPQIETFRISVMVDTCDFCNDRRERIQKKLDTNIYHMYDGHGDKKGGLCHAFDAIAKTKNTQHTYNFSEDLFRENAILLAPK